MENPIKMDDLGENPLFSEPPKSKYTGASFSTIHDPKHLKPTGVP